MVLDPEFSAALPAVDDVFACILQIEGEIYRDTGQRRTSSFLLGGQRYFLKLHCGVGWGEILMDLVRLRKPVLGARDEWLALQRLQELGIETMVAAGYGQRGANPARLQSFVITRALEATRSLEDLCRGWGESPPPGRQALWLKRALIRKVAEIARILHENGINHRDFYLCHFLLDCSRDEAENRASGVRLYLIDLHRAQLRNTTPMRWRVKDIGSLFFSSMHIGLTQRDIYRFMKAYRKAALCTTLRNDKRFWQAVHSRAHRMYQSFYKASPPSWY